MGSNGHILLIAGCLLNTVAPALLVNRGGECTFNTKGTCEYEGQVFGIGESWITKDCYQCVCMEPFGVGCCDHSLPVDYPEWCEVIRKPDSCTSVAVMRANHKLPCLYGKWGRTRPETWNVSNILLLSRWQQQKLCLGFLCSVKQRI
ncbi:prostate-associated microseminoprotein-like isoform X2 [Carassius carassius]|uniref:prostate-associated microseminoprotein-like isoform X2 n=1 Tax=Carassius carassius TaxID=217509 RepID=UPI0028692D87|nr:prostate-associated microseminoprotein-like isoform X2 [Carassius carassius]